MHFLESEFDTGGAFAAAALWIMWLGLMLKQ